MFPCQAEKEEQAAKELAQINKPELEAPPAPSMATETWASEPGAGGDVVAPAVPLVTGAYTPAAAPTEDWSAEAESWSEAAETGGEWGGTTQWSAQ
jgi:hypothetical protein